MSRTKQNGDSAFNKLVRLLRLVKYVADHGRQGVSWSDIRHDIYDGEIDNPNTDTRYDVLFRKFTRDKSNINSSLYIDDEDNDVEILQDTAIIKMNKERKYVIRNGLNLMLPMTLKRDEALALVSGVRLISEFIPPLRKASNNLWLRLKNQMSQSILDECEFLTSATVSAIPMAQEVDYDVFMKILEALNKQNLNIKKYIKAWPDDLEQCEISPQVIYVKHHSWYVLGEVSGRQRILRIDRIKSVELGSPQKNPLKLDELNELERDIQLDYNPYEKAPVGGWNVKLRVTGSFVQPCIETQWFPGEKKTLDPQTNSLIYEVNLKGLEAITLWVMRALDCMEVLEPAELRERIDRRVNEYLRKNAVRNKN